MVDGNGPASEKLLSLNLHVDVAEDSIRRWPNDAELSCLSCWVLQSVIEGPPRLNSRCKPAGGVLPGEAGDDHSWDDEESASTTFHENTPSAGRGGWGELVLPSGGEGGSSAKSFIDDGGGVRDSSAFENVNRGANDGRYITVVRSSTSADRGVFKARDDTTSDVLIGLDVVNEPPDAGDAKRLELGEEYVNNVTSHPKESAERLVETTRPDSYAVRGGEGENYGDATVSALNGDEVNERGDEVIRGADRASTAQQHATGLRKGEEVDDEEGCLGPGGFRGEEDEEVLERLLQLAETTKVRGRCAMEGGG